LLHEGSDLTVRLLRGRAALLHFGAGEFYDYDHKRNRRQGHERELPIYAPHHREHEQERKEGVDECEHALLKKSLERIRVPRGAKNQIADARALMKAQ
jgi:hypothetical protein